VTTKPTPDDLAEAARVIEQLTGVPPAFPRKMTRREKQTQKERVAEFLSFPIPMQEALLKYGRHIKGAYSKTSSWLR